MSIETRRLYWQARKAFCRVTCESETCPLIKDDIEGGGGLVVSCKKLESFDKLLSKGLEK